MKAFGQLKTEVARKLSVPVGGDYANTQIRDFLQHRYSYIYNYALWPQTLDIVTVTIPANQNYWVLPKRYETALALLNTGALWDGQTFDLAAFARRNLAGDTAQQSVVRELAPLSARGVTAQPASAGVVKISSSASGDTSKQVYVKGVVSGEIRSEVITTNASNGTTVVSGTLSFSEVIQVSKLSVPTTGVITVTDSAGTTTLATIAPWETTPQYKWYRISPTSTEAQTVTVVAKKRWIPFLNNADCAVFDMDAALISGGTADGWKEHRQYDMATSEEAEFESELADLVTREFNLAGQTEMWQPAGRF